MDKSELRKQVKRERLFVSLNLNIKLLRQRAIIENVKSMKEFQKAKTVLCYLALNDEIKTDSLINYSFKEGKRVAVPYCIDDEGNMEFYLIKSISDTEIRSFGVREPIIEKCEKLTDFSESVVIVPALCFDKRGYRLGYGKGYYDRFLKNYSFISVGLCYNSLIKNEIPINEFDQKVDYIVTENQIISVKGGVENG